MISASQSGQVALPNGKVVQVKRTWTTLNSISPSVIVPAVADRAIRVIRYSACGLTGPDLITFLSGDDENRVIHPTVKLEEMPSFNSQDWQHGLLETVVGQGLYALTGGEQAISIELSYIEVDAANANQSRMQSVLEFSDSTFSFRADDGDVLVTVDRTLSDDGQVSINATSTDGTAIAGVDFTAVDQQLTFSDGTMQQNVALHLINAMPVADVTFTLTLSRPLGGAVIGTNGTCTVTIAPPS